MLARGGHLVRHAVTRHLVDGRPRGQLAQLLPRHVVGAGPGAARIVGRGRLFDPHAVLPVALVLIGPGQRRGGGGGRHGRDGVGAAAVVGAAGAILGLELLALGEARVFAPADEDAQRHGGRGEGDPEAETDAEADFGVRGESRRGRAGAVPAGRGRAGARGTAAAGGRRQRGERVPRVGPALVNLRHALLADVVVHPDAVPARVVGDAKVGAAVARGGPLARVLAVVFVPVTLGVGGEAPQVAVGANVKDRGDAAAVDGDAHARGGAREGVQGEAPRVGVLVRVLGRGGGRHVGQDARGAVVFFELGDDLGWHAV